MISVNFKQNISNEILKLAPPIILPFLKYYKLKNTQMCGPSESIHPFLNMVKLTIQIIIEE